MSKEELSQQALHNAQQNLSLANYPTIFKGFLEKGIPEDNILPRENIFTFNAWLALGRHVRRGEHGVKVFTFIAPKGCENDPAARTIPWTTTVFHISQTDPTTGVSQ